MASPGATDKPQDDISKMCEEVETKSSKSFLVQFYGIHEVIDSHDNNNLLVSQQFRDIIDKVEKDVDVSFFFVFQDLHAIVGSGVITRKDQVECC
jgi:hypothetical protein